MADRKYLIGKGAYYYRPNAQGYTSNPQEAGRYTWAEAWKHSHPNGEDGPRDGMYIVYERDFAPTVPPSSPGNWQETLNELTAAQSEIEALRAEVERLREERDGARKAMDYLLGDPEIPAGVLDRVRFQMQRYEAVQP